MRTGFPTYRARQIDSKEPDHDDLIASHKQPEEIVYTGPACRIRCEVGAPPLVKQY